MDFLKHSVLDILVLYEDPFVIKCIQVFTLLHTLVSQVKIHISYLFRYLHNDSTSCNF